MSLNLENAPQLRECPEDEAVSETLLVDALAAHSPPHPETQPAADTYGSSSTREGNSVTTSFQEDHQAEELKQEDHGMHKKFDTCPPRQPSIYFVEPASVHTHTAIILLNGLPEDADVFVSRCLSPVAIQFPNWRWVFPLAVSRLSCSEGSWFMRS